MFESVLIKLSGEVLSGESQNQFDDDVIHNIISDIKYVIENGTKVTMVVGGGNFWRGRDNDFGFDRTKVDSIGMLATVMNALYLTCALKNQNIKSIVMTPFEMGNMTFMYRKDLAMEYIDKGYVVIFAGGLGHPFFSTDTVAALRAAELESSCILYAKNIDGIYSSDPKKHIDAIKYNTITYTDIIKKGIKAIDLSAMCICDDRKIPSIAFDLKAKNSIKIAALNNDEIFKIGTKIIY